MYAMELRPYQKKKVEETLLLWKEGKKKLLLVAPTGAGKTVMFSEVASRLFFDEGKKILVACHREELVLQTFHRMEAYGLPVCLDWGESRSNGKPIVVSSVITAERRNIKADVLIVDEAHHSAAKSFLSLINRFDQVLGCTATPFRGDYQILVPDIFESYVGEPITIEELQEQGWLVDVKTRRIPVEVDLSEVRIRSGDFAEEGAAVALEESVKSVVESSIPVIKERNRCVVFVPMVRTSKRICSLFEEHGIECVHVDGECPDQKDRIEAFRRGKYKVLSNALLLTEGVDIPEIDTILLLRPTKSPVLLSQMIGRGLRPATGKKDLLVLDPIWIVDEEHPLDVTALIAQGEAGKSRKMIRESMEQGMSLREAKKRADRLISEMEISLLINLMRSARNKKLDILQWIGVKTSSSTTKMATPKQAAWIARILPKPYSHLAETLTRSEASQIISIHLERREKGLCTFRQAHYILKEGLDANPLSLTFEQARNLLDGFHNKKGEEQ